MAARVIHNRVCQDIVGCKMTVPDAQVNKVLEPTFWPEHMECRRWEKNKVSRRQAVRWRDHNDNERQYEQCHTREATHKDQREYRNYDADYHSYHRDHHDWRDSNDGHHRDYNEHNNYNRYEDNDNYHRTHSGLDYAREDAW